MTIRAKIRTWNDMEKEYGLNSTGSIAVPGAFPEKMEEDMPIDRAITIIDWNNNVGIWNADSRSWVIRKEMIEKIMEADPKENIKADSHALEFKRLEKIILHIDEEEWDEAIKEYKILDLDQQEFIDKLKEEFEDDAYSSWIIEDYRNIALLGFLSRCKTDQKEES